MHACKLQTLEVLLLNQLFEWKMLPFPEVLALVHDLCCDYNFAAAVAHINALFFLSWGKQNANPGHMGYREQKSKALMKNVLAALHWRMLSEAPCCPTAPRAEQRSGEAQAGNSSFFRQLKAAETCTCWCSHDKEVGGAPVTLWGSSWSTGETGCSGKGHTFTYSIVFLSDRCFFMSLWPVQKELCWKKSV